MKKISYKALLVTSCISFSSLGFAQQTMQTTMPPHQNMPSSSQQAEMQQKMMMRQKQLMMQRMNAYQNQQKTQGTQFPSPKQLAEMTPPKPLNKQDLKKRLDEQLARVKKVMSKDKQQADKYAEDFARFQKHQADTLKKMMEKADKQREIVVKRMEMQHAQMLANFEKSQSTK